MQICENRIHCGALSTRMKGQFSKKSIAVVELDTANLRIIQGTLYRYVFFQFTKGRKIKCEIIESNMCIHIILQAKRLLRLRKHFDAKILITLNLQMSSYIFLIRYGKNGYKGSPPEYFVSVRPPQIHIRKRLRTI